MNKYMKGSALNPTYAQLCERADAFLDDHPDASWDEAMEAVAELQRQFVESHASDEGA